MSRFTLARRVFALAGALLLLVDAAVLLLGAMARSTARYAARAAWWRLRLWAELRRYRVPPELRRWVAGLYAEELARLSPWRMVRDALERAGPGGGGAPAQRPRGRPEDLRGRAAR